MSDNLQMLFRLFKKVSNDTEYFAWYFDKYMMYENKNLSQLVEQLKIDETQFYHLSFCKVPNGSSEDFKSRMKNVADFINVNIFPLLQIIRSVDNAQNFDSNSNSVNATLMAAREKQQPNSSKDE